MTKKPKSSQTKKQLHGQISDAVEQFDWDEARRLAAEYAQRLRSSRELKPSTHDVLKLLLKNRQHDAVTEVADAALAVAPGDRTVWRNYAQALVDQGRTAPALRIYTGIADDPAATPDDHAEARGGVGRCYKQLLLTETDPERRVDYLRRALEAYNGLYQANRDRYWHGINAVALLKYAERKSLAVEGLSDPGELARNAAADVLGTVKGLTGPWETATACEAHIARNEIEDALRRAREFVENKQTDAFMIASFLRQVREVWQPDPESVLGTTLLPLLRSALVSKSGGSVTLKSNDLAATRIEQLEQLETGADKTGLQLEKVFGPDRFQTLRWWRNGLMRCRAVVRIDDLNGVGRGTGFLINGGDLHPSLPALVVITNCHVVPDAVNQHDVKVAFHGLDADSADSKTFDVKRMWWHSPPSPPGVDTAVLELSGVPDGVEPIPLADPLPAFDDTSRAYIIGHPRGYDQPQFSIQDNLLLDYDDTHLHYRAPTEGGSSGSPVFESQWKVIGLHHAGSSTMTRLDGAGTYAANEALRIDAIRSAITATPPVP